MLNISVFVLGRIIFHKSKNAITLRSIFPDLKDNSYLKRPSTRNKIVGYILGIESWNLVLFGKISENHNLTFLLACLIVAYDNAVDEEKFNDWNNFEKFLKNPILNPETDPKTAIGAAKMIILTIKNTEPLFWESAKKYITLIHCATKESFLTAAESHINIERLRKSSYDKGGYAFLLWTLANSNSVPENHIDIIYKFGAAVQIADDIYDRREDKILGQSTLASHNLIQAADRKLIRESVKQLPKKEGSVSSTLLNAWEIHLRDSLLYYDSGKLSGRWKYSIGQNLFEIGVKIMPVVPFSILRMLGF